MTDQMFVFLCRDIRKFAFDYRRGEMQSAEQRKFEEHVGGCQKCQDYVDRLEGMLDGAATHDYTPAVDKDELFSRIVAEARTDAPERIDRDRLFDRITSEIDLGDTKPPIAAQALELAEPHVTVETERDELGSRPVALYVIAALAAGVLIGIGFGYLYPVGVPAPQVPEMVAQVSQESDVAEDKPTPSIALAELGLQPTPAGFDDVRVFGEPTASWNIRTQGARRKMELREGTVLVEFVPRSDRELVFVADRFTVRVTGTIFYASAERGVVGVVTGSVEVDTPDGATVTLKDGQEWLMDSGVRSAPEAVRIDAALHVDVAAHERELEQARSEARVAPKKAEAPRPPASKEVVQTPREELRAAADRALRGERYAVAAQYYERMVEELSAADPDNASLRLDLARIYIRHLNAERRALVHLRRFISDRPGDPLNPTAREELCRIAKSTGDAEPGCAQ